MLSIWKPIGLMSESLLADFNELRQGFIPPNLEAGKMPFETEQVQTPRETLIHQEINHIERKEKQKSFVLFAYFAVQ